MKIGVYSRVPEVDVDTCIDKLKLAKSSLGKQNTVSRETFIDAMGFKVTKTLGGRVSNILSSMGSYGLIDSGKKEVRITNLSLDLIYNEDPAEVRKLRSKTVRNVEIFDALFVTYGTRPSEESVRLFLRDKAGINNPEELATTVKVLNKLVRDNFQYIDEVSEKTPEKVETTEKEGPGSPIKHIVPEKQAEDIGEGILRINLPGKPPYVFPIDDIDLTISIVTSILNKEKERRKNQEPVQTTFEN